MNRLNTGPGGPISPSQSLKAPCGFKKDWARGGEARPPAPPGGKPNWSRLNPQGTAVCATVALLRLGCPKALCGRIFRMFPGVPRVALLRGGRAARGGVADLRFHRHNPPDSRIFRMITSP